VLAKYRETGMGEKVWEHTMQIFAQADEYWRQNGSKRPPDGEAEGSGRSMPNPIGWRPAS